MELPRTDGVVLLNGMIECEDCDDDCPSLSAMARAIASSLAVLSHAECFIMLITMHGKESKSN